MMRHTYLWAVLLFGLLLVGCGQNGPLYLPGNPSEMKLPPQAPEESTNDEDEES